MPGAMGDYTAEHTSDDSARAKVTELIREGRICMFTTMTPEGRHVSRPMALQEAEFDGDLWFFVYDDSPKVVDIATHPQVNVAFSTKSNAWVSVSGRAEVVHDRAKAEQLWSAPLKAWFPDGLDTDGLALIKVTAESAEYWDAPHGKVVTLIQYAASVALRRNPSIGENQVVDLT